jgi:site-specific DNA-methyltransferase (adenine-specific)
MNILKGDCFELIKQQPDNSVDLVITSPPYSDIINYGQNVSTKKPNQYVDWILPLFKEIWRVLKPTGSFILNINDKCEGGVRNTYIYDLISRNNKETKLKLYDTYIWWKKSGIPNGSNKRFRNTTEFIFHFVKDPKQIKFYMDRVLEEPKESSKRRYKYEKFDGQGQVENGVRKQKRIRKVRKSKKVNSKGMSICEYIHKELPDLIRPDNVFRFATAAQARDNLIKHPAPFHKELPLYFINLLTDEGDIVMDCFSGIGTTGLACVELKREYIGYELNETYVEFSLERLKGELNYETIIEKYDMNNNLLKTYKSIGDAVKDTEGTSYHNILRNIDRNDKNTNGGFIWKKINKKHD